MSRSKARLARRPLAVSIILLLAALVSEAAAQPLPSNESVAGLLQARLGSKPESVIVVGLYERKATRTVAFGPSGSKAPVSDGDTVFEIGSITKTFTAALLADMVVRGEVRITDPVSKYLPPEVHMPTHDGRAITLLDLATQSSGLPRLPGNLSPRDASNPYGDYTVAQLYEFLSGYSLSRDPGEKYEYSNLGFGLLGHALARRAAASYEEVVRARILDPLKMTDTGIALTPGMKARLAPGHDERGRRVPNWDIPTLAGAGALRSSVGDMLKYIGAQLGAAPPELGRAIGMTQEVRHPTGRPGVEIALAWHVLHRAGHDIVWHNGGTGGYHSFVGFETKCGCGVVVLSSLSVNSDDLGLHLLDDSYPLADAKKASRPEPGSATSIKPRGLIEKGPAT